MSIAQRMMDWPAVKDRVKITNIESLPRGTGRPYLEVIESPYDNEFVAFAWRRTLPAALKRCHWLVRF